MGPSRVETTSSMSPNSRACSGDMKWSRSFADAISSTCGAGGERVHAGAGGGPARTRVTRHSMRCSAETRGTAICSQRRPPEGCSDSLPRVSPKGAARPSGRCAPRRARPACVPAAQRGGVRARDGVRGGRRSCSRGSCAEPEVCVCAFGGGHAAPRVRPDARQTACGGAPLLGRRYQLLSAQEALVSRLSILVSR